MVAPLFKSKSLHLPLESSRMLCAGGVLKPTGQLPSLHPSLCAQRVLTVLDSLALVVSWEDSGARFLKSAFAEWPIVIGSK